MPSHNPHGPTWDGFHFTESKELDEVIADYINGFEWVRNKTPLSAFHYPIILCVVYLAVIYLLWLYKKDKQPSKVNGFVAAHNFILVVMSATMCFGTLYSIVNHYLDGMSLSDSICDPHRKLLKGANYFWCYMFYLSKYYEFVDTIFIVLKKRELTFLHLYHHCLIVVLCWIGMDTESTNQWFGVLLNTFVHVCMYYYYFLAALGKTAWWKKYLTTMQMVQFCIVAAALFYWLVVHLTTKAGCSGRLWSWGLCLFGQVTFLILFKNFYNHAYKKADKKED